jgi:TDG/mug DNA glycosylase family protein
MSPHSKPPWEHLRLRDRIAPGVRVLLVGINPGVKSAQTGHHFAGPSNRFWRLLFESGLVPERISHLDDVRLPEWGLGVTNLVARPSPGIDVLRPAEYVEGWHILEKKIDRFRPEIVAFVGVTIYRALLKVLGAKGTTIIEPGFQHATVHDARIFVLPNPSGRNANYSYDEMLAAFAALRQAISEPRPARARRAGAALSESAAPTRGRFPRGDGTAGRTTPSTPAAAPSRKAQRKRAGSR